jgi:two-component system, OmpR family, sensor histidine kinase TctE
MTGHSLARRLAWRLGLLFVLATAAAAAALWVSGTVFTEALQNRALEQQSAEIARHIVRGDDGRPHLAVTPELQASYSGGALNVVIRTATGEVIATLPDGIATGIWSAPRESPEFFEIEATGEPERYGVTARHDTAAGAVWISVIEGPTAGEAFVHALLVEFFTDAWWTTLPFVALVLLVGHLTLRSGFKSMRALSNRAQRIGPGATAERLPIDDVPAEVRPLVDAVNGAFDRLETTIQFQREFTANAAHQLRTPLAILTARLDGLEAGEQSAALRRDVERINRLVHQLLKVARLDSLPLDVSQPIDLHAVAKESVVYAAPLAIKLKRELALVGSAGPIWVCGNAHAIGDALVNLIENALTHAPTLSAVTVTVADDGTLSVSDRGPGIAPEHREEALRRFWRGKAAKADGAGLGLAIVAETARHHGAQMSIEDNPGGGARIVLRFSRFDFDGLPPKTPVKRSVAVHPAS